MSADLIKSFINISKIRRCVIKVIYLNAQPHEFISSFDFMSNLPFKQFFNRFNRINRVNKIHNAEYTGFRFFWNEWGFD